MKPHHVTIELSMLGNPDTFMEKLITVFKDGIPVLDGAMINSITYNNVIFSKDLLDQKKRILNEAIAELEKLKELI